MAPHALRVEEPLELPVADPVIATKKSQQPLYRSDYEIPEQPLGTRRPLRVICLGAGYSGLMMAIVFSQKLNSHNASFVIYERNSDLGGTWLENRYPGCQCDIPAHNYAFSFEPNPEWPNYYATAEQIYAYIKRTANKYDVDKYIKYNHSISRASWDDARGKWKIKVQSQGSVFEDECDVFINAGGILK